MTGAHTRIVWSRGIRGSGGFPDRYDLMGLDSDEGGVRKILTDLPDCSKPLLSGSGDRIVYSDRTDGQVYLLNWDGSNHHAVAHGYATDFWRDPHTHIDWIYIRIGQGVSKSPIRRFQANHLSTSELVWDKTPVDQEIVPWFQVSHDGKTAGAAFPWPKCGVADLTTGTWHLYGLGCWTSLDPDGSGRFFHLEGTHTRLVVYDSGGANKREIQVNREFGPAGGMVLYPRWSNDSRFLTLDGPSVNPDHTSEDYRSELYLGRFDSAHSRVVKWLRITHNDVADIWGDAWIAPAR